MLLETNGNVAGVGPGVDLERVRNAVLIEDVVQLPGVDAQSILIAHVDRDGSIPLQLKDVLVDERQRRVGGPFRQDRLCLLP